MSVRSVNGIRGSFLNFFTKQGHTCFPSAPLVAEGDASLLFTNAGMVPFKQAFVSGTSDVKTAVSSQKCLRAGGKHNDLENVGYTNRHHTFFEMLGNFSFGEYFKDVAIKLAWDFVIKELCLDKNRLWITVYVEDQEAYDIWKKVTGFSDNKIIRIHTDDNFWSMGDTGPCGPCSEIFYDYGEDVQGGLPGTEGSDGARFTEIWNLVFMQYCRDKDGKLHTLPRKCIDTGMGLERIAAVVQGVCDNYDTDMFRAIIETSCRIFGNPQHAVAHRVIADHIRAATFLIAEGLVPGNEGRNYVLRRIIRRAVRYAYQLGGNKFSVHEVVPVLTRSGSPGYMGEAYPEIVGAEQLIMSTLKLEEEGFVDTLRKGTVILDKHISALERGDVLAGEIAFNLYDTYGFPLDITLDVAREKGLKFDEQGFNQCMADQKERSRKNWVGSGETALHAIFEQQLSKYGSTYFVGYDNHRIKAAVKEIVYAGELVDSIGVGKQATVILDVSPFYAESGGQEGDRGFLTVIDSSSSASVGSVVEVNNTKKAFNRLHMHECVVKSGTLCKGDIIDAVVDEKRRARLKANHSATHILHDVLRSFIGAGLQQKGSLVAEDKLRFDYSHTMPLTKEQIQLVEREVNDRIIANSPVLINYCSLDAAVSDGAVALFGEKYNNQNVRVVSMGSSKELCCGTHVRYTGDIGSFRIVSESGIALGVRRIEAITGHSVVSSFQKEGDLLQNVSESLGVPPTQIMERLTKLFQEKKELSKKLVDVWKALIASGVRKTEINPQVHLYTGEFKDVPIDAVAEFIQCSKGSHTIFALSSITDKRAVYVISVGEMLAKKLGAIDLVKELHAVGGKGGGNANMARVSLPDEKVREAEAILAQKAFTAFGKQDI
ncbi:alanine--tRNA ligase [Candidatus Anaplasma sp. TIGMIC]|uniref:alanine--tRNA ligase n=1 Tax=Candidatus Anaplasma sp. TIGMIC TaxID=3020713 RepID=UPI00232BE181|nr:alanine--tRNA ligase [Candidatus Anaplasma sp. TIGMIC]MDB1135447.1 alanine--tRNA ligase [Candidatus Anaplasma sp. TIGMIC]